MIQKRNSERRNLIYAATQSTENLIAYYYLRAEEIDEILEELGSRGYSLSMPEPYRIEDAMYETDISRDSR